MGACTAARSQNYNEYLVWFGNERKVSTKIIFDTIITNMIMMAPVSTNHAAAIELANSAAKDYGLKARVKYIRRLKKNEEKKSQIKY